MIIKIATALMRHQIVVLCWEALVELHTVVLMSLLEPTMTFTSNDQRFRQELFRNVYSHFKGTVGVGLGIAPSWNY